MFSHEDADLIQYAPDMKAHQQRIAALEAPWHGYQYITCDPSDPGGNFVILRDGEFFSLTNKDVDRMVFEYYVRPPKGESPD